LTPRSRSQCVNTPAGAKVDAHGCPLDSDADGVPVVLNPDVLRRESGELGARTRASAEGRVSGRTQ